MPQQVPSTPEFVPPTSVPPQGDSAPAADAARPRTSQGPGRPRKAEHNPHFFAREDDGAVRLRLRFNSDEASLIEEAAGETPLILWIHRVLADAARRQVRAARAQAPQPAAPEEETP